MTKLRGAAKAAFLRRMAKGRRKTYKTPSRSTPMARRRRSFRRGRRYSRVSRGARRVFSRRGGSSIVGFIKPMASGIGMARVAEQITGRVAPQFTPVARLGGAYIGGGLKGLAGEVVYEAITGTGGLLNIFGGGGSVMTEAL